MMTKQALILAAFLGSAGLSYGQQHPKLSSDLEGLDPASSVDVIIQYKETPTEAQRQKVCGKGGIYRRDLSVIKGGHYSVPATALAELADDPDVVAISRDRIVQGGKDLSAAAYNVSGTDIGVAVLDSGVNDSDDLDYPIQRVVYRQDFTGEGRTDNPSGHRTHVSGAVGTLKGSAPNANIVNFRVLNSLGSGSESAVIAGIQQAIALKSKYDIRVLTLALQRGVHGNASSDPLCQAVESAWTAGIVVAVDDLGRNDNDGLNGYGTTHRAGQRPFCPLPWVR